MNKNILEIIDSLIELAPNSKELQVSLSKEDFDKAKENLESETSQGFSWGTFEDSEIQKKENIFSVVRQNVAVYFLQN